MNRLTNNFKRGTWLTALLMVAVAVACSDSAGPVVSPVDPGAGPGNGQPSAHGPAPVVLGGAASFVILAKSATSNVPTSTITGNIGLSPAAASFITGLSLVHTAGTASATSAQVTGSVFAADYAVPTPANLTAAIGDMQTAYTAAAGRTLPDHVGLGAGNIGGLTLPPGLYKWSNSVTIPVNVTLSGSANDTWIFQIAGGLSIASAKRVVLSGGALPQNIVWQVAGIVSLGTTSHMEGVVLGKTQITLGTGASLNGRLFAQTQVTLAGNAVVEP